MPEPSTNFAFVAAIHQRLFHYATSAERLYAIDPAACVERTRKLADWVARETARSIGVDDEGDFDAVLGRVRGRRDKHLADLVKCADRLRIKGNVAVHSHSSTSTPREAVEALRGAWELCRHYARFTGASGALPTVFSVPTDPATTTEDLQTRLDAAERALDDRETEASELRNSLAERPAPIATNILARRISEAAAATQTLVSFPGLAGRGRNRQVLLASIYIQRSFSLVPDTSISGEALLSELDRSDDPRRYLVVGPAGVGKTTFCRHIVEVLADRGQAVLLLRLRAQIDTPGGLLEAAAQSLGAQLALPLSASDVARLLEDEPCTAIFDGFDEIASEDARRQVAERLNAFAVNYPRVQIVITSREQVLRQTPLAPLFTHLRITPFSLNDASALAEKLFEVADIGSSDEARAFVEQIAAHPSIFDLLSTPLTVTLLTFLRAEPLALPTTASGILEQCLRIWLDRWPRVTDRPSSTLTRGEERAMLTRIALVLYDHVEREQTLGFGELIREIAGMRQQREPGISSHDAEEAAERWLEHHLAHVGLLEEDDRGNIFFAHWSLMQFLVACGSSPSELAAWLTTLSGQDICDLACEIHLHDPDFFAALSHAALANPSSLPTTWLIRAASRESQFTAEAVTGACRNLVAFHHSELARLVEYGSASPGSYVVPILSLLEIRPSYTAAVHRWTRGRLGEAHGEDLRATVSWAVPILGAETTLAILSSRDDRAACAADLMPLWPTNHIVSTRLAGDSSSHSLSGAPVATWAVTHLDSFVALRWALSLPDDELVAAATAALGLDWGPLLNAVLATALTARALSLGLTRADALSTLTNHISRNQARVVASPGEVDLLLGFRTPVRPRCLPDRDHCPPHPHLSKRIASALDSHFRDRRGLAMQPPSLPPPTGPLPALSRSPTDPDLDLHDLIRALDAQPPREMYVYDIMLNGIDIREASNRRLVMRPAGNILEEAPDVSIRRPNTLFLFAERTGRDKSTFGQRIWSSHYGEAALALFASAGMPEIVRRSHLSFRLTNRWLLEAWPLLESRWSLSRTDLGAALLIALGWSQHVTTATWPATEGWSALMHPPPDAHWLLRAQAQLCWLAADRRASSRRAALRRALRDGDQDPNLNIVAATLRRIVE
jgi:GTPase SAR1 family protein